MTMDKFYWKIKSKRYNQLDTFEHAKNDLRNYLISRIYYMTDFSSS